MKIPDPMIPPITIIVPSNRPIRRARWGAVAEGFAAGDVVGITSRGGFRVYSLCSLSLRCHIQPLPHAHLPFRAGGVLFFELAQHFLERLAADLPRLQIEQRHQSSDERHDHHVEHHYSDLGNAPGERWSLRDL